MSPLRFVVAASSALTAGQVGPAGVQDAARVGDRDVADAGLQQDLGAGDARPRPHRRRRPAGRSRVRPVTVAALRSAASTTIAVPCWSSWKTGMSSASRSRSSISKQRGAEMSSRLMPPKDGAIRTTVSTISSASVVVEHDRDRVEPGELLEQRGLALHHRQRGGRADVAEAEHRGAVADHRDQPRAPGVACGPARASRRSPCRPRRRRACRPARGLPVGQGQRAAQIAACRPRAPEHVTGWVEPHCLPHLARLVTCPGLGRRSSLSGVRPSGRVCHDLAARRRTRRGQTSAHPQAPPCRPRRRRRGRRCRRRRRGCRETSHQPPSYAPDGALDHEPSGQRAEPGQHDVARLDRARRAAPARVAVAQRRHHRRARHRDPLPPQRRPHSTGTR